MVKLLIIADDFTGALDTGIQFVNRGIATQVFTGKPKQLEEIEQETEVLVIDSESRPMKPEAAYCEVKKLVEWAGTIGIELIFKKTDSALRGNIGSELQAVSDGGGSKPIYFLPGFPKMKRLTIGGTHYISGELLEKSVFGQDPFEPVTKSYIPDIIRQQSQIPVECVECECPLENHEDSSRITVCDVKEQNDIDGRLEELIREKQLRLVAGCAALADSLADRIPFHRKQPKTYRQTKNLLIACGSLNKITEKQLDRAQKSGFYRLHLTMEQKLQKGYYDTQAGQQFLQRVWKLCEKNHKVMIDSMDNAEERDAYLRENEISWSMLRQLIPEAHGYIADYFAKKQSDATVLMTGGDTLMGYMKLVGISQIRPVCEIERGVVVSILENNGFKQQVISKSGGFGTEDVFIKIADKIVSDKS